MSDDPDDLDADTPDREAFQHDPVEHASVEAGMSVADLAAEYGKAGVGLPTSRRPSR
jgi:deoxyhypusine synthase